MLLKMIISVMIWFFVLNLPLIYELTDMTPKQFRIFCWYEFIVIIFGIIIIPNLK